MKTARAEKYEAAEKGDRFVSGEHDYHCHVVKIEGVEHAGDVVM